jgi:hypothetical protein
MPAYRSVVEEPRFVAELAAIDPNVRRTDEALYYVKELLARDPDAGISTATPGVKVAPIFLPLIGDQRGWTGASVFYIVRPATVHLVSVTLD